MTTASIAPSVPSSSLFEKLKASKRLPSPPGTALRVLELCRRESVQLSEISDVVSADPALSGRLLKYANSSVVGVSREVTTVRDAMLLLGLRTVKMTALGFSLATGIEAKCPGFALSRYWTESFVTAITSRRFAGHMGADREEAFTAGLLSGLGQLALVHGIPTEYGELRTGFEGDRRELTEREREAFGFDHAEFGSRLLDEWKLPKLLVEVLAHQFDPDNAEESVRPLASAVDVASKLTPLFVLGDGVSTTSRSTAREAIEEQLELSEEAWQIISEEILADFQQITDVFDVELDPTRCFDLYAEAQEEATKVSIVTQIEHTKTMEENRDLLRRATTDVLTGVANRAKFDERLGEMIADLTAGGSGFGLVLFDIDHFKQFNDTYGHDVGDLVLKRVSQEIEMRTRSNDLFARFGGEEFVLLAPGVDRRTACTIAARLRKTVEDAIVEHGGNKLKVTISLGVALTADYKEIPSAEQILVDADKQLYLSKKAGRNTWSYLGRTASQFAKQTSLRGD